MKERAVQALYSRHAREGGHPVRRAAVVDHRRFGILDHPLEPVIGLAKGETRWRMMTAELENPDVAANGDI
ncbi:MAG TPA: hypothetical protein VK621_21805 [Bradyrhizobium sp.]|nr:hypothetical protein [Bradyrhizobium sp.]